MKLRWLKVALVVGLLIVALLLPWVLSSYYVGLVTEMMIFAIFAMSLDLLLGYTGLPSLGHAAYFGISGYTVAILSLNLTKHFGVAVLAGLCAAMVTAAIFGLLAVRTHGTYFLMITLALAQVLWGIAFKWRSLTGGDDGLPGIPRPDLGLSISMWEGSNFYFFTLVVFVFVAVTLLLLVRSPVGLALRGVRESESRMQALGYNVWTYKYLAFVIAGMFAGISGMLLTYYNGFVSPADLNFVLSAKVLLMVALGGSSTLYGPVLGAFLIVLLENLTSAWTEHWLLILGAIYVVVVLFAPDGIVGTLKIKMKR